MDRVCHAICMLELYQCCLRPLSGLADFAGFAGFEGFEGFADFDLRTALVEIWSGRHDVMHDKNNFALKIGLYIQLKSSEIYQLIFTLCLRLQPFPRSFENKI